MTEPAVAVLRRTLAAALRRGELGAAATLLEKLRAEEPLALETRTLELELLVRAGRNDEAAALAGALVDQFPSSARALHWAGRAAYRRREYACAEERFRESERLAPHWTTTHWRARSLTQLARFDEAEPPLERLSREHPECLVDLAWLHERRGEPDLALRCVEELLALRPEHEFAKQRRLQLRAALADAGDVTAEVEALLELGEPVPEALLPRFLDALLRTGRGAEARERVGSLIPHVNPRTAVSLAWVAHKLGAFDLSCNLFLRALPHRLDDRKLLAALERAARVCRREEDVACAYEALVSRDPRLHGRIRRLRRKAGA